MPTFEENNFQIAASGDNSKLAQFVVNGMADTRQLYVLPNTATTAPVEHIIALTTLPQGHTARPVFYNGIDLALNEGDDLNTGLVINAHGTQSNFLLVIYNSASVGAFVINKNGHVMDSFFTICDGTDVTKRFHFQLEGISSGADRTITMPNSDGTVALIDFAQTWPSAQSFTGTIEIADTPGSYPRIHMNSQEITLSHSASPTPVSWLDDATGFRSSLIPLATTSGRTWNLPNASIILAGSAAALTSGRVPFATTGGVLTDDSDLTFATDTLTATKIVASTSIKAGTAAGYISSDGSTGATGSFTTVDLKTVTVKDGIIVSIT